MNNIVELVRLWGRFEAQYQRSTLEGFYRYQSPQRSKKEEYFTKNDGKLIHKNAVKHIILLRRTNKFPMFYSDRALEGTELARLKNLGC